MVVAALAGCGRPPASKATDIIEETRAALTNSDVLGFENVTAWTNSTKATLSSSSTHSQGSFSLSVKPSSSNGNIPLISAKLSSLTDVSTILAFDIMLPTQQPNPSWFGNAQISLNCPSRNIFSAFLGQVELLGKPLAVWNTISFPLTNAQVSGLLNHGYSDLTITVSLNVPVPTTGIYLVDNLRVLPVDATGCGGLPNGTLCTDRNTCTASDHCTGGVCGGTGPATCATPSGAPLSCHAGAAPKVTVAPAGAATAGGLALGSGAQYWTLPAAGTIARHDDATDASVAIVTSARNPFAIATDGTNLFWTETASGDVMRAGLDGTGARLLATGERRLRYLAVAGANVYWTGGGGATGPGYVKAIAKSGGAIQVIVSAATSEPWGITVAPDGVIYWADRGAGTINAFTPPAAGAAPGPPVTFISGLADPTAVAADASQVFWIEAATGAVVEAARPGASGRRRLALGDFGADALAVNATDVFWNNPTLGTVRQASKQGGETRTTLASFGRPRTLATSGTDIFVTADAAAAGGGAAAALVRMTPIPQHQVAGVPGCPPGVTDRSNPAAVCPMTALAITPLVDCVRSLTGGALEVHFGYTNADVAPRELAAGTFNDAGGPDACQPVIFESGTHHDVVTATFTSSCASWTVGCRTAVASLSSPRCP